MLRLVQGGVKAPCGVGLGLGRRVAAAVSTPGRAALRHSPADGVSPCRGGVARWVRDYVLLGTSMSARQLASYSRAVVQT